VTQDYGVLVQLTLSKVFSQLYYIPLYFQSVKAKSPIATGVNVLPITGSLMPSAVLVGYLITSIGRYRWAVWLGELVTTLATGMLILWDAETSPTVINAVLVILGLGNGLSLSSLYTAIQAAVDERDAPSAASMYSSVRSIGMALGVPIGGSAFQNLMKEKLRQEHLPTSIASHAESDLDIFKALPDTSPFRNSVTQAYVAGCRGVFEIMTGVSVLGLILCLLIKDYPIDRRAEDIHVLPSREATADAEMVPVANGVSK
jgi:MFS family permease